ncbi:ankyrin repeat domain-containing protein 13C-like [Brachyhypopomus gauderio]|uniref:ankyrin repeat domain-containing protein 13C-like n=1 Tax=Brachyhypopomus gauderio TaxID=698409 RepID=UPI0040436CD6
MTGNTVCQTLGERKKDEYTLESPGENRSVRGTVPSCNCRPSFRKRRRRAIGYTDRKSEQRRRDVWTVWTTNISEFPVHQCVFRGDVDLLSSIIHIHKIAQKDMHGNTPLHLAVMMGHKECAHLLLDHSVPVRVRNVLGWSPLSEAISYGDRQMITTLLRTLKQQCRESVESKRPKLVQALWELGDFYLELHWDFQSWVPLLSGFLPSDTCKIYKQGINIRLDTTLVDCCDRKCRRGNLSFIFHGDAAPAEAFIVLDNKKKVYRRICHKESEISIHEEVEVLMSTDIYSTTLSTKNVSFSRSRVGWIFKDGKEKVGRYVGDLYTVKGLVVECKQRREHLMEENFVRNTVVVPSLSEDGSRVVQCFETVRRGSLSPPKPHALTWEEYVSAEVGKPSPLGREQICKVNRRNFKATVAMSQDFPLSIQSLLSALEVIAPFKHFIKLKEFVQMKLPPGFPIKLDIPVFPTTTATVTFREFRFDTFEESIFTIPSDYKEDL